MDAIKRESLLLYEICCGIGVSSSQRKRNIRYADCVTTMNCMNFFIFSTEAVIVGGSWSEGINPTPFALHTISDVDGIGILRGINVQEHVDMTNTNQAEVLQLLVTDSPEHVLLEFKSYELKYKTFNNTSLFWLPKVIVGKHSKYLVSSSLLKDCLQGSITERASSFQSVPVYNVNDLRTYFFQAGQSLNKTTIHGPAVMSDQEPLTGSGCSDCVSCLRCYEWPTAAHEWIDRARPHGWPSQDLIDQIMYDGCELVPVGRKDHPDEDEQWKLSFSRAETRLIRNFNIYQAQCYQLLKIVKSRFISSVVADSLSSYHIKTVMLHTVEQTDPKVWREDNLVHCFMMCLSNLKRYLTDKFLPQYFIVRQDLLEPKVTGDVHQKVLDIVTDLEKKGWKCVLQCPLLQFWCQSIQETVGSIPYNVITDALALKGNRLLIISYCSKLLYHFFTTKVSYNCYFIRCVVFCGRTFLKPTSIHPSVETARVLQLLRKGELGLLLTVIRAMAHPDLRPGINPLMKIARQCLEESCHVDVSSCRLKFATFFFHLGEYDRCIATVQDVLERFKDVWVVVGGVDTKVHEGEEAYEKMDTSKLQSKLNRVLQLGDNGFPFISNHLSLPAFFTHWEVAVAPKGVHFVHQRMRNHNVLISEVCCIDSIVYAHYLLMESYLKIDKHDHAEHALINMKESIWNKNDDMFDRNCLCFCKEDILLLQYSDRLMQVAKNVKDKLKSEQENVRVSWTDNQVIK